MSDPEALPPVLPVPLPDGPVADHDPDSGALLASYTRVGGQIDGQYTSYGPDQMVRQVMWFHNGVLHGDCITYDAAGLLLSQVPMAQGVPHGEALFYDQGLLVMSLSYAAGRKQGPSTVFSNGRPVTRMAYDQDQLSGEMISLDPETGQPIARIPHQGGQPHGMAQYFTPDGYLSRDQGFHAGRLEGQVVDYTPDGKVIARRNFHDGVLHGPSVRYAVATGKPQEIRTYNAGALVGLETYDDKGGLLARHGVASHWAEPAPVASVPVPSAAGQETPWWKRLTGA